jgi:glutathione S-transferase
MTSGELLFYTNPMSRGRIVRWMLEETGAAYRTETLAYGPAMKDPAYLAINPMGKVPAIVHRGVVVTEAAAICAYLADAFPAARLAPAPDSAERGTYYRWLLFGAGPLEAAVTNKALGFEAPAERLGMVGYGSLEAVVDALAQAVAGSPYLCGDAFTAADVYVGSQIGWGLQFGTVPNRPEFEAYVARIYERPAHIRATRLDDALLPPAAQTSA